MRFSVLIPARYASTRLPGKPLSDIAGKPMVVRVAERARASGAQRVVIATDDERIRAAILAKAREVLKVEFPELAGRIAFHVPDEKQKRHGQAIAAASLPKIQ